MVTKEELEQFDMVEKETINVSKRVTAVELSMFEDNNYELGDMLSERKKQYEKEKGVSATQAYFDIEDMCQISKSQFTKVICGSRKATRTFLYKFVVGFKMTEEEANKYFDLCGGPLTRKNKEDYICLNALRDKDSIEQLVSDFEKHLELKIGFEP